MPKHHGRDPRKQTLGGRLEIGIPAGFRSVQVAGFILEKVAGFVGIRNTERIVWVEADPKRVVELRDAVARCPQNERQHVLEALVCETDGETRPFYCFSNDGGSSSVFRATALLSRHWPTVRETGEVKLLVSRRLDSLLAEAGVRPNDIDVLVFDVQGVELMALKGSGAYLEGACFVEVEVSTSPIYSGARTRKRAP